MCTFEKSRETVERSNFWKLLEPTGFKNFNKFHNKNHVIELVDGYRILNVTVSYIRREKTADNPIKF